MKEYISTYIYRVPSKRLKQFITIQKRSAEIYKNYGALSDVTYEGKSLEDKYGCTGISSAISTNHDEVVYFGISKFKDKAHHDEVMAKVDKDHEIGKLYKKICSLLDVKKIVRGEFSSI